VARGRAGGNCYGDIDRRRRYRPSHGQRLSRSQLGQCFPGRSVRQLVVGARAKRRPHDHRLRYPWQGRCRWGGTRIPLFFVADDHQVQVNAYGSDVSAVEGGPIRHPDPKHERPIDSGVSYATADGSRAEFKISDRLLTSSNLLSNQSFIIKTAAAIMSKRPWYSRFVSPITLQLSGQSPREGEGTLEYGAEMNRADARHPQHPRLLAPRATARLLLAPRWRLGRHSRAARSRQSTCRLWVKRVVLTLRQSLPVYPDKQTFSHAVGMSQNCHHLTWHLCKNDSAPLWARARARGAISPLRGSGRERFCIAGRANRSVDQSEIGAEIGKAAKYRESLRACQCLFRIGRLGRDHFAFDVVFRDGLIATGSFRLIERAVTPLNHGLRGFRQLELRNPD
jgi:hypothetical protein